MARLFTILLVNNDFMEDTNVQKFKHLGELNKYIEENITEFEPYLEITNLLVKYRNIAKSDEEKQKTQWDLEFFLFAFKGANIFSFTSALGKEPNEIKRYPDLDEFQLAAFNYLKLRISETKSPIIFLKTKPLKICMTKATFYF